MLLYTDVCECYIVCSPLVSPTWKPLLQDCAPTVPYADRACISLDAGAVAARLLSSNSSLEGVLAAAEHTLAFALMVSGLRTLPAHTGSPIMA